MTITDGLIAVYDFQAGYANDLTGNGHDIVVTNADFVAGGLRTNANGEYGTITNTAEAVVNSDRGTVLFYFTSLSAFEDGSDRCLFGHTSAPSFFIKKNNSTPSYVLLFFNDGSTSHYILLYTAKFPDWTTGFQLAMQWDKDTAIYDGKNIALNINGVYITPDNAVNPTSWSDYDPGNLGVLNDLDDTTDYANGVKKYMQIYNTVKTAPELLAIYNNPNIVLPKQDSSIGISIGCAI